MAGNFDSKAIATAIKSNNGIASFKTISGGMLMASIKAKDLILTDEKGGTSMVTIKNVYQSNGVIHVIDMVVMPK